MSVVPPSTERWRNLLTLGYCASLRLMGEAFSSTTTDTRNTIIYIAPSVNN